MDAFEAVGLSLAAFLAGAVNAVGGGGSLISFPALLAAGYPAKTANVTNTVALWPGYLGGSLGYRRELGRQRRRVIVLLATSEESFEAIVPFLILFACALMLFQERLAGFAAEHRLHSRGGDHIPLPLHATTFLVAAYGAYFGAGLGIMTLAFLLILLPDDIQHSNALKGMLSLVINAVAVVYFAAFGPVEWGPAMVMAAGAIAGGYGGVHIARLLAPVWLRRAVIAFGVAVAAALLAPL